MEPRSGSSNVTVTYLEGTDEWGQNGEWVAQPDGDDYVLRVCCESSDIVVSEDLAASQRDAAKVLTACFGDDWTVRREDGCVGAEPLSISTWTCALRDRAAIDELLRTSRRVARMVRRYIPEVRYAQTKHLERDVQLVDWSERDETFYNTLRMSVVASATDLRTVQEVRRSNARVVLRASLWCIVGRNDTCEAFWTLQSVEPDAPIAVAEEPEAVPQPEPIALASEDDVRRLRRAVDRVVARVLPSLEADPDSDADEDTVDRVRLIVARAERALESLDTLERDRARELTAELKAASK